MQVADSGPLAPGTWHLAELQQLSKHKGRTVRGQIIHWKRDMRSASSHAEPTVSARPPRKPSHVFLGEILISGVRPKQIPTCRRQGLGGA